MRFVLVGSALAVLAVAGSCGGGGGGVRPAGAGYGPELFTGLHRLIGLSGRSDVLLGPQAHAEWGTATSDGVSEVVVQTNTNLDGAVSPLGSLTLAYSVAADGAITISGPSRHLEGRLGEAGRVAVLGQVAAGDPEIVVIAEFPQTALTNSDLSGPYRLIHLEHDLLSGDMVARTGTLTADGNGGITFGTLVSNREGVVSDIPAGGTASYAVGFDGGISLTTGGATLKGTVLAGGGVVLLAGGNAAGASPGVLALVRASFGAGGASFAGTYGVVSFEVDPVLGAVSVTGRVEADNSGVVRTGTTDTNGTVAPSAPWSATSFVVTSDGGLVLFDVDGHTLDGAVSDDGRYAILGGGTSSGSRPTFQVLVRE